MLKFTNKQYYVVFIMVFITMAAMVTLDAIRSGEPSAPAMVSMVMSLIGWVSKPKG